MLTFCIQNLKKRKKRSCAFILLKKCLRGNKKNSYVIADFAQEWRPPDGDVCVYKLCKISVNVQRLSGDRFIGLKIYN